jgi:hypothetical protein
MRGRDSEVETFVDPRGGTVGPATSVSIGITVEAVPARP